MSSCFYNFKYYLHRYTQSRSYLCLHLDNHRRGQKCRALNSGISVRLSLALGFLLVGLWQNQRLHWIALHQWESDTGLTRVKYHSGSLILNALLLPISDPLLRFPFFFFFQYYSTRWLFVLLDIQLQWIRI